MTARGIRNKNPGNLEKTVILWDGEVRPGKDERFCEFETMAFGCRALIKTLRTYVEKRGLNTVRQIIHRWAPSNENNTEAYVRSVASAIRHDADEPLRFAADPLLYLDIAKAIARHENGADAEQISDDDWEVAMKEAGL